MSSPYQAHSVQVDKHLELISARNLRLGCTNSPGKPSQLLDSASPSGDKDNGTPLCMIFSWFAAKRKHLMKFAQLYLDQDFDVLLVKTAPMELFMPLSTLKRITGKLLQFLHKNKDNYGAIVVHGFSIGAGIWGRILYVMQRNPSKYGFLHEKIKGQVWDSPFTDVRGFARVGSLVAFSHEPKIQKLVESAVRIHVNVFQCEYQRPANAFRALNLGSPYLVYASEDDDAALISLVATCAEQWQQNGSKVYWKVWGRSQHVCHMRDHPEEYKAVLKSFLNQMNLLKYPSKMVVHSHSIPTSDGKEV